MKLLLFLPAIRSGGAERVLVTLAGLWAEKGYHVTLATLNPKEDFFPLSADVHRIRLDIHRGRIPILGSLLSFARKQSAIRKCVLDSNPDVVVSFLNRLNVRVLLACLDVSVPIIVSERIAPEHTSAGLHWKIARNLLYRKASIIISQTEREGTWFRKRGLNTVSIPNPISPRVLSYKWNPIHENGSMRLVAMGRFTRQKGFDLLIHAFSLVVKKIPSAQLYIYGDGPDRDELSELVRLLSLEYNCMLPGVTTDPYGELAKADAFVLSSRYEGFPNVLAESMAIGVPSVSFDCPNGPREMIQSGISGILVGDFSAGLLAEGIIQCLSDSALRSRMSINGKNSIMETCSSSSVMKKWDSALQSAGKANK